MYFYPSDDNNDDDDDDDDNNDVDKDKKWCVCLLKRVRRNLP